MQFKRVMLLLLTIIMVLIVVGSVACTSAPSTTPTTPKSAPASTPVVAPIQPIQLVFTSMMAETHHLHANVFQAYANEVEKRTGGRVKTKMYAAESLGKATEFVDMLANGTADVMWDVPGYYPGRFPLVSVIGLPFSYVDVTKGTTAARAIWKKGWFDKELANSGLRLLHLQVPSTYYIYLTKTRPSSITDLKGVKVRSPGGAITDTLSLVGMAPVNLPMGEMYTSMQRGVLDASVLAMGDGPPNKMNEISKYLLEEGLGGIPVGIAMSQKKWDELPPDIQKIFNQISDEWGTVGAGTYVTQDTKARDLMIKAGMEMVRLPPKEKEEWMKGTWSIWEKWANDMEAKGLPGKAIMQDWISILKSSGEQLPY